MEQVKVVMSTFNGEEHIIRQIDSIIQQSGVHVSILIRDDGSTDETISLLRQYSKDHQQVQVLAGRNIGWRKSFIEVLKVADSAEYYAFSDQDDVWIKEKLEKSIKILRQADSKKPAMVHCNRFSCSEDLKPFDSQSMKVRKPVSRKNALTQEYAQGCTIVMNSAAKKLVTRYQPNEMAPHDFWTGLICYYFGSVYYLDERLIYHVRYNGSQSFAGDIKSGQKSRLKSMFTKKQIYYNPAEDLMSGYSDLLTKEDLSFLKCAATAKRSLVSRMRLLFDRDFRRVSRGGTFLLKINVLLGRF